MLPSSQISERDATSAHVVLFALCAAFLFFPLIVIVAELIWGPTYGTLSFKYFVYALSFTVIPLLAAGGCWLRIYCKRREGAVSLLDVALTGPGVAAAALYLSAGGSWAPWNKIVLAAVLGTLAATAGIAAAFFLPRPWQRACERISRPLASAIWAIAPLVFAAVVMWGEGRWLIRHITSDLAFDFGLLMGAACVAAYYIGPRMLASRSRPARTYGGILLAACAIGSAVVILAAVFYPLIPCDAGEFAETYDEHVGPAASVLAGGAPMVDAFSQYGVMIFLVYAAAFKFVFPPSFFGALAVTQLSNLLAPAVALAICWKAARNRFLVLVVIGAVTPALPWIWYAAPANSGSRFATPMLLLLALARLSRGRTISWLTVAAMMLCSLWSFEVATWTLVTYAAFLAAVYLTRRRGLWRYLKSFVLTLLGIACAHFIFGLGVFVSSGSWPRYDIYLSYIKGNVFDSGFAVEKPELGNPMWILQSGICVAALAYALSVMLWLSQIGIRARWNTLAIIFPGAVLSVMALTYWVSRPFETLLLVAVMPSFVSLLLLLDGMLMQGFGRPAAPRLLDAPAHATLALSVMLLVGYLNSRALTYIENFAASAPYYKAIFTGRPVAACIGERAAEAVTLVKKYEPNRSDALFFMPGGDDVTIALYSGHRQRLGYSTMSADVFSAGLMRQVYHRLHERVKAGDVLITTSYINHMSWTGPTPKQAFDNYLYGAKLVDDIATRFQLCEIERTPHDVVAVRLMPKGEDACRGTGKPFAYEVRDVHY